MKWELERLGWRAFQDLAAAILGSVFGQSLETFEDGNDAGRDGAFHGRWNDSLINQDLVGEFVIQAKYSAKIGSTLSPSGITDELAKIRKLVTAGMCDVYVLVTNMSVTGDSNAAMVKAIKAQGVKNVRIWGRSWVHQQLNQSVSLRRMVPRVYGLGDLSQIMDDRKVQQAQSILEALGSTTATFVATDSYRSSLQVLREHGAVLLLGGPTVGKSVIAQMLALGALDSHSARVIRSTSAGQFLSSWNPESNESTIYWIDDAFGELSLETSLLSDWMRHMPELLAAKRGGDQFVFTSRDYIYRDAQAWLQKSEHVFWGDARLEISVADLTQGERSQILYNHIRLGGQPTAFKTAIKPHLAAVAALPSFTPGLAFRLGNHQFTKKLDPPTFGALEEFFENPADYLAEILGQLSRRDRAALALLFASGGVLWTPLQDVHRASTILGQFGATVGELAAGLESQDGTLVRAERHDKAVKWQFAHPTIRQATNEMLQGEAGALSVLLEGTPLSDLLSQIDFRDAEEVSEADFGRYLRVVEESDVKRVLRRIGQPDEFAGLGYMTRYEVVELLGRRASPAIRALFMKIMGPAAIPFLKPLSSSFIWNRDVAAFITRLFHERLLPVEVLRGIEDELREQALNLGSTTWYESQLIDPTRKMAIVDDVKAELLEREGLRERLVDGYHDSSISPESYLEDQWRYLDDYRSIFAEDSDALSALKSFERELSSIEEELSNGYFPDVFEPESEDGFTGVVQSETHLHSRSLFDDVDM